MSETPDSIGQWIDDTFPGTDPESPRKSLRALEEMVELCAASGAYPGQVLDAVHSAMQDVREKTGTFKAEPPDAAAIASETADVFIVLCGIARMRGFDLQAEVDRKMAVNRSRRWKAHGDGTGYHIKELTSL